MAIARPARAPDYSQRWACGRRPIQWALQVIGAASPWRTLWATRTSRPPHAERTFPIGDDAPDDPAPQRNARHNQEAAAAPGAATGRPARGKPDAQAEQIAQFETFFRRYERDVFGYVWRLTGDEQTAYDLSQEVFLRAWRVFARVQNYEQPRAWLLRVASNLAINHRQRASLAASHSATIERFDALGDGSDFASQLATGEAVRETLLAIPTRQRIALVLRVVYGYGFDQIAATLGMTLAAAKMTLSRARERFRQHYLRQHSPEE